MHDPTALFAMGGERPAPTEVERLAALHFGLRGQARPLPGERDWNYHLRPDEGPGWVFKIHPPAEDPLTVDLQVQALQHIAKVDPRLSVPLVHLSVDLAPTVTLDLGAGPQIARALSWVRGVPMAEHRPLNPARLRALGAALARLDRAMRGFFHPAGRYPLLWDVSQAGSVRPLLPQIPDERLRGDATRALDHVEQEVLPRLPALRAQPVHNDANPGNVLFDAVRTEEVAGFLDFGDMVHAPLICNLAIAASYHLGRGEDPLEPVRTLVAAYHAVNPLEPGELALLVDLIMARAVLSPTIACWHASGDPEEMSELTTFLPKAADRLALLLALPREPALDGLLRATGLRG